MLRRSAESLGQARKMREEQKLLVRILAGEKSDEEREAEKQKVDEKEHLVKQAQDKGFMEGFARRNEQAE